MTSLRRVPAVAALVRRRDRGEPHKPGQTMRTHLSDLAMKTRHQSARLRNFGVLAIAAFALAGCGNSGQNLLTTGSVAKAGAAPAAPVVKPEDPPNKTAVVSARAQKCGFYFDADALRAQYLASEAQAGTPPDEITKLTKVYDYTNAKTQSLIAPQDDYCDKHKTASIKKNLNRYLAGDFTPEKKKEIKATTLSEVLADENNADQKFNPDWVHAPDREPVTVPVEPQ